MFDSKRRKQIGARAKQRRLELNLPMQYVADQMGVNKSTVQRYESGAIDNTKKMVLEGLSRVLDVTPEWLLGETDALDSETTDALEIRIRDSYQRIQSMFPLKLNETETEFAKTMLLFLLESYEDLIPNFQSASERYSDTRNYDQISGKFGIVIDQEFKDMMYRREINSTINNLEQASQILALFPSNPQGALARLNNELKFLSKETRGQRKES